MTIIENARSQLPTMEESIRNIFLNCRNRKRIIPDVKDHFKSHLKKAKHDLSKAEAEFEDLCWDWTIVKTYYAIHHAANALLSKSKCTFSKDHSCLIVALKYLNLIEPSLFEEMVKIHERFSDVFSLDITFQLRKISQYNVDGWENLSMEDAEPVLELARKFVAFVEVKL